MLLKSSENVFSNVILSQWNSSEWDVKSKGLFDYHFNKAYTLHYKDHKFQDALKEYDECLKLKPGDRVALKHRNRLVDLIKNQISHLKKGVYLIESEKYEEALEELDKAIEENRKLTDAYMNKGLVYCLLGNYEKALNEYDEVLNIDVNHSLVYFSRALTFCGLNKYDIAVDEFDKAIKLDPNNIKSYFYKGDALGNLGKYEEAVSVYDKCIQMDSNCFEYFNEKAACLYYLQRFEESIEYYNKALALNPSSELIIENLKRVNDELHKQ